MVSVPIAKRKHAEPSAIVWRAVLSAFCTSLIGIGLARFAYTPLLPVIIGAHWFEPCGRRLSRRCKSGWISSWRAVGAPAFGAHAPRRRAADDDAARDRDLLRLRLSGRLRLVFRLAFRRGRGGGRADGARGAERSPPCSRFPARRCRRRDLHGRRRRDRDLRHARAAPACAGTSGDVVRTRSGVAASDARRMERVAARLGARGVRVRSSLTRRSSGACARFTPSTGSMRRAGFRTWCSSWTSSPADGAKG